MFLGIDGGGTKTKVMLVDEVMHTLAVYESGPSSIRTVPIEDTIKHINEALQQCRYAAPKAKISGVFAGLGDIASTADEHKIAKELRRLDGLETAQINVKNDVYNAHAGALEGDAGIAIIIGTGSVAFGIDEAGQSHRAGGYSYKEGDFGSAYWLGREALSLLGKALDHRVKSSPLTDALQAQFKLTRFIDVVDLYETHYTERTAVANLAKLVTHFALEGDPHALNIIERATDELVLMIQAVDQTLNLRNKAIGIIGSLGNAPTPLRDQFMDKVQAYDARFDIFPAKQDPVFGACVIAKKNWIAR